MSPYKDPQRQLEARREWGSAHQRKASDYRQSASKYDDIFDEAIDYPGVWFEVAELANQNSAGVQAWRIKNGFYRSGVWEARTRGATIQCRFMGDAA